MTERPLPEGAYSMRQAPQEPLKMAEVETIMPLLDPTSTMLDRQPDGLLEHMSTNGNDPIKHMKGQEFGE